MSPDIEPAELNRLLAREYFSRTRVSSLSGVMAISLMAYLHLSTHLVPAIAWWVALAACLGARAGLGQLGVTGWLDRYGVEKLLWAEAALSALLGIGWGASLFLFDSGGPEPLFYFRLVIVAAVAAFVLSSSTAFLRMPLICVGTVGPVVLAYLAGHPYVQPNSALVAGTLVESAVIVWLAYNINRRIHAATYDHMAVIRLSQMLEKSARTDELTQIANRRGILETLSGELAKSTRHALPLSVLMADIDHFKSINDTLGHAGGDEALRSVVGTLNAGLRTEDSLGRLGGEEFLVLLPMLDGEGAQAVAERLRRAISEARATFEGKTMALSISIGIGCHRQGDSVDSLLARADAALYAAKGAGRNRVMMEQA